LSLGDTDGLGIAGDRVAASWVVAPTRPRGLAGGLIRHAGRAPATMEAMTSVRALDARNDLEAVVHTRRPGGHEVAPEHHAPVAARPAGRGLDRDTGLGF
jgi:hypothetical protein